MVASYFELSPKGMLYGATSNTPSLSGAYLVRILMPLWSRREVLGCLGVGGPGGEGGDGVGVEGREPGGSLVEALRQRQ